MKQGVEVHDKLFRGTFRVEMINEIIHEGYEQVSAECCSLADYREFTEFFRARTLAIHQV